MKNQDRSTTVQVTADNVVAVHSSVVYMWVHSTHSMMHLPKEKGQRQHCVLLVTGLYMRRKNEPIDVFMYIDIPTDGDPRPCWPWTRGLNKTDGRPYFTVAGVRWLAYRLVYTLVFGPIEDGQVVRHKECDNEACLHPYHLLAGTHGDNERDKGDHDRWGFPQEVLACNNLVLKYKSNDTGTDCTGVHSTVRSHCHATTCQ